MAITDEFGASGYVDQVMNGWQPSIEKSSPPKEAVSAATARKEYKFNDYEIKKLMYPANLDEPNGPFGGHKVVFFINVSASGRKQGGGTYTAADIADIPSDDVINRSGQKLSTFAGQLAPEITSASMKRLDTAIMLHMPNSIMQGSSVMWNEEDISTGLMVGAAVGAAAIFGKVGMSIMGAGAALKTVAERTSRLTIGNSMAEMLFKGVGFRQMEFNYMFAPKSKAEVDMVMRIIRTFKYHMLPEYKLGTFLYSYPSEFNIKYYTGTKENEYIDKQITAVLESVRVDSAPNNQFSSFADGMPQQINLALTFKEIGTISKESASQYSGDGKTLIHGV
jgi:hypothetical protein